MDRPEKKTKTIEVMIEPTGPKEYCVKDTEYLDLKKLEKEAKSLKEIEKRHIERIRQLEEQVQAFKKHLFAAHKFKYPTVVDIQDLPVVITQNLPKNTAVKISLDDESKFIEFEVVSTNPNLQIYLFDPHDDVEPIEECPRYENDNNRFGSDCQVGYYLSVHQFIFDCREK